MKVVRKVMIHLHGYMLELENGELGRRKLKTVENEDGLYEFVGLEDRQILEEYLDTEGRKKRIVYLKDRLLQLQEAYVCECGGNMTVNHVHNGYDGGYNSYYDVITYYKCEKCSKEYSEKRTYAEPEDACM